MVEKSLMCGIAGTVNVGDRHALQAMTDIQRHRGPDDSGIWWRDSQSGACVGLGSRRLAILDLSAAGHMPMSTIDGQFTIVYNGEIYNYLSLRRELEARGYRFRSNSDTEVILYLYQEYGSACIARLNGIFSIAIWDEQAQELFLARDHFGIKPLYYWRHGDRLAFASEAKALLVLPEITARIDLQALDRYLTFLWVPEPLTMFEGIHKLPAAHWATFGSGQLTIEQYWNLSFPAADARYVRSEADLADELRERLQSTVRAQMLSDVPVGAFLSAGLDSSSIVAAMANSSANPVRTFTIGFPGGHTRGEIMDDTNVARRTADAFGCQHTEIIVEPEVAGLLPELIWHMDDPTADPAIITAFLVNREAKKDATVLLSGVGGDELFGGYRKYRAHKLAMTYQKIPSLLRNRLLQPAIERAPSFRGTPLMGYVRLAKKMARSGSLPPEDRFIADSVYMQDAQRRSLFTAEVKKELDGTDPRDVHRQHFADIADADFLHRMQYVDMKSFMVSLNLNYNDKMSMAASTEVRVPFLDWQLAEWVAGNIPPEMKLSGGTTKRILRTAMEPVLPGEVLRQRKSGFGAPIDAWLSHDLRPLTEELLGNSSVSHRGLFQPDAVEKLLLDHRAGNADRAYPIWSLLTLELWMRSFID